MILNNVLDWSILCCRNGILRRILPNLVAKPGRHNKYVSHSYLTTTCQLLFPSRGFLDGQQVYSE